MGKNRDLNSNLMYHKHLLYQLSYNHHITYIILILNIYNQSILLPTPYMIVFHHTAFHDDNYTK